jgi:O-antigen/teichoic acid export membrane protein
MRPAFFQSESVTCLQTTSLFVLDGLANVTDFAFHFWLGRVLIPSEFAILQTLNSIVLVYVTASGVFQPVVGRFIAEARTRGADHESSVPAIFQSFLRAATWLGLLLAFLVFAFAGWFAELFNLPVWSIQICAGLIFLSTLRPVAIGVLQGQERFISFGLSRLLTALGRLVIALLLVYGGFGLMGAVLAFPLGWLIGVTAAFFLLGSSIWRKQEQVPGLIRRGGELSFYALIAYIAFMSLTSLDLVWVNRSLSGDIAGAYASLVLLRRVIALLPGVAVTVMFPRIASALAQHRSPHRLLANTAAIILTASGALTIIYFLFSEPLIMNIFGEAYRPAFPLLGWMGIAMVGVSLSSVWLNYYLAEQPRNYIILLVLTAAFEWVLLAQLPPSMESAVLAFGAGGWLLTFGGLLLYLFRSGRLPRNDVEDYA